MGKADEKHIIETEPINKLIRRMIKNVEHLPLALIFGFLYASYKCFIRGASNALDQFYEIDKAI